MNEQSSENYRILEYRLGRLESEFTEFKKNINRAVVTVIVILGGATLTFLFNLLFSLVNSFNQ